MTEFNLDWVMVKQALYNLVFALVVLFVGLKAIAVLLKSLEKSADKKNIDPALKGFLMSILGIILKVTLFITAAGMVGIKTTSFIAVLGAAGLAVGLALQGTLANFAGGTLLIILKPFKVGDFIEAQGYSGTVKEIQVFCTILLTADKKTIIIPNGPLASGSMINYSREPIRRLDMTFGIGYDDDLRKAKEVLNNIVTSDDRVLKEPQHTIAVSELADSSVNFTVRMFVNAENYWPLNFDMNEKVKLTFDEEKISIPFPQQDLHLHQHNLTN